MSSEIKQYNFDEIAQELGYVPDPEKDARPKPGGPGEGGRPPRPNFDDPVIQKKNAERFKRVWTDERVLKLLDYFKDVAASGEPAEFLGHPICWAMIALQQELINNPVSLYMPPFQRSLQLLPFKRTADPKDNPMMKFTITEKGDNVHLVITILAGGNPDPFQMSFADVEIQDLAPGKNIWLELEGNHFLFTFGIPKTFGRDCSTIYYKQYGTWYCCVSNDSSVKVGDKPKSCPFEGK